MGRVGGPSVSNRRRVTVAIGLILPSAFSAILVANATGTGFVYRVCSFLTLVVLLHAFPPNIEPGKAHYR